MMPGMYLTDYIEMSPSPTMLQSSASGSASLALSIFGITFVAFCVWLTVRIINRRERWAKWTQAAVVGVPMLYVLSFGPAMWMLDRGILPAQSGSAVGCVYYPIVHGLTEGPRPIRKTIEWYANLGTKPRHERIYDIPAD
jgi:hypothetical protein